MTDSNIPIISTTLSPPPSPDPSSTSDAEDAYNTAEARIHFGPLKSPEKRISAIVARHNSLHPTDHSSPLRRSPRLSTIQPPSPLLENRQELSQEETTQINMVEEDEEIIDILLSREGTPDVELALQDEPSSALAIKISRAHDNPSPPPSPPIDLGLANLVSPSPHSFLPLSLTASLLDSNKDVRNTEDTMPSMPSDVTTGLLRNLSPVTPSRSPSDLISFESFSSPAPVFRTISPSIPVPQPSYPGGKSNPDDQASHSLNFLGSPKVEEVQEVFSSAASGACRGNRSGEADNIEEKAQDRHEEQSVLRSLLVSAEEGTRLQDQPTFTNHSNDPAQMPTRRSSFPRRSVSRYQDLDPRLPQPQQASAVQMYPQLVSEHLEYGKTNVERKPRRKKEDQVINSPPKSTFFRQLRSLSPTSNDLLSSLVTPSEQPSPFPLIIPSIMEASSSTQRPFPQPSALPALPQTPRRSTSPIRFASPLRSVAPEASNTDLQAISWDNPVCTPARRISIEDAIAQGHISPLVGSQLLASSRVGRDGLHKPLLTIPSTDSPARRILALPEVPTPEVPKKWKGIRFGSPTRVSSKERLSSVEQVASGASEGKYRERGGSVPPSTGTSSFLSRSIASSSSMTHENMTHESGKSKPAKLPFPLVPSMKDIPLTVPEERQPTLTTTIPTKLSQATSLSPSKSTLKQTTSRIPTRAVKPYAKPQSKLEVDKGKSVTRPGMPTDLSKFKAVSNKALPAYRTDSRARPLLAGDKPEASPNILKRKRAVVEVPSPVKPWSAVSMRQVPRVVVPNAASTPRTKTLISTTVLKKPSQHIRRVIDKSSDVVTNPPVLPISQKVTSVSSSAPRRQSEASVPLAEIPGAKIDEEEEIFVPKEPSGEKTPAPFEPIGEVVPPSPAIPGGVRRTTRVRKVLNPSLISDALVSADVKPRHKPSGKTNVRGDLTYSGMSATALRALTTSNTVKNQRYLAAKLETEIIRREGDRPESPAVKIKTVLQREQEEKKRQRKERASRRARQSGQNVGHLSDEDKYSNGDMENESNWDDQSISPSPKRHKRGSGDEEEYNTPVGKLKRLKLVDEDDKEELIERERRVKWDRGLFTTISLDQVKLGTRRPPKENITIKGCLAPAAKTLPLDNLGNLPDTPLTDLVEENIVVKRFVYDNDVEVVEEVVVKNTRARSKKGKS